MKGLPFCCPAAPAWHVDWPALIEKFEWIRAMRDFSPQDEVFHAEGTVWTHVGMVCEALAGLDEFRALPELDRHILFAGRPVARRGQAIVAHGMKKAGSRREGILSVVPLPPGASYGNWASTSPGGSKLAHWFGTTNCHSI